MRCISERDWIERLSEHVSRWVCKRTQVWLINTVPTFVASRANSRQCRSVVTCHRETAGEVKSIIDRHVCGAGTTEVDGVFEDDIFSAAYFAVTSVTIFFVLV
jgi:hypothetical protein